MEIINARRLKSLGAFIYINLKLNIETQRGVVFGQLMIGSLRLFFISKIKRKD